MLMRASSVFVVAVLLSSLAAIAIAPAPAQACGDPIIIVERPVAADSLAGTSPVTAQVKYNKVPVEMVLFMVDSTVFAVSKTPTTAATYAANWNTTNVANGTHQLRAAAVLADGSVLNSAPVPVVVKNGTAAK